MIIRQCQVYITTVEVEKKNTDFSKSVLFQLKNIFNKQIKVCCNPEHKFSGWCPFTTFHSADGFCVESSGRGYIFLQKTCDSRIVFRLLTETAIVNTSLFLLPKQLHLVLQFRYLTAVGKAGALHEQQ